MSSTQPLSVLVADRDVETRDALSAFLFEEGFQPTELADPSKAPSAIKDGRYQMVLLDLGEPEVDGVSVLEKIRCVDDDLCVICMTGRPSVETAVATMKHRAFDYLKKPFEIGELRPVLRDAIREHGLLLDVEKRLNAMVGERARTRRHEMELTLKHRAWPQDGPLLRGDLGSKPGAPAASGATTSGDVPYVLAFSAFRKRKNARNVPVCRPPAALGNAG
jgi:DNA-binding NtrC family response regulator